MAEEGGKYTRSSLVMGLNFLFFFLGLLVINVVPDGIIFDYNIVVFTFFVAITITIGLSFLNRSPIGGMIIGVSFSGSYWIGFMNALLINYRYDTTLQPLKDFGPYALYVTGAFSALGLFFGVLGFLTEQLFVENPNLETYVFRDYWSNLYSLGKSNRREIRDLDQRLRRTHITAREWWRQQIYRVKQAKPDLIFVFQTIGKTGKEKLRSSQYEKLGDVYDISSGQRIYDSLIDPSDLMGVYKPSIISIPSISNQIGGGRRLAIEELISRFLDWFTKSNVLWLSYLAASIIFTYALYFHFDTLVKFWGNPGLLPIHQQVIISTGVILSIITLYFVQRFHSISHLVYEKRPDERLMIFILYLILFLFYVLCYQVIISIDTVMLNTLSLFDIGPAPWIISMSWLTIFTVLIFLTYIFIHRESEVTNIYLYDDSQTEKNSPISPFKDSKEKPYWLKNDGTDLYWVLRYMYYWRYELTLIPHPDWERIEVWVDAKTSDAKWVVSDYHYRELWYKVEGNLRNKGLHVGFLANFHTPIPFVNQEEIDTFTSILEQSKKTLLNILLKGKVQIGEKVLIKPNHPPDWIESFGLKGLAANFCSNLNWCYWRYPWGMDNYNKYMNYPSTITEEQPPVKINNLND